jgi:hypothetical protein
LQAQRSDPFSPSHAEGWIASSLALVQALAKTTRSFERLKLNIEEHFHDA